jgi:hypothetical protein
MEKLISSKLDLVTRLCAAGHYDYIIVGSGIGGGILARTLVEDDERSAIERETIKSSDTSNKPRPARVLIIDRGGMLFSTHCLNTPSPRWNKSWFEGPSMDTDMVFNAVKDYVSTATSQSEAYVGGPVYALGGRSTVWGLYTPPIDEEQVEAFFPSEVHRYLYGKDTGSPIAGYNAAYRTLVNNSEASILSPYPENGPINTNVMDSIREIIASLSSLKHQSTHLYKISRPFQCSPMAAEFVPQDPNTMMYRMPMCGYSTVSWILDKVFNKSERLNVLANTQVVAVNRAGTVCEGNAKDPRYQAESLTVLDHRGKERTLPTGGAKVILSAGSIGTATIALHSGLQTTPGGATLPVGKGLTDHDIWGTRFKFYGGPLLKKFGKQALRLDSWVAMQALGIDGALHWTKNGERCLVNITINADSFLGRAYDNASPTQFFDKQMRLVPFEQYMKLGHKDDEKRDSEENETQGGNHNLNQGAAPSGFPPKPNEEFVIQIVFCFPSPLVKDNRVLGLPEPVPTVEVSKDDTSKYIPAMQQLAQDIRTCLSDGAREKEKQSDKGEEREEEQEKKLMEGCEGEDEKTPQKTLPIPEVRRAGFGVVAHEVGTMRMPSPFQTMDSVSVVDENPNGSVVNKKPNGSVVDEDLKNSVVNKNLKVHGWDDLYACDLSVFPVSPSANPSLTLAALAQRLGCFLENKRQAIVA